MTIKLEQFQHKINTYQIKYPFMDPVTYQEERPGDYDKNKNWTHKSEAQIFTQKKNPLPRALLMTVKMSIGCQLVKYSPYESKRQQQWLPNSLK